LIESLDAPLPMVEDDDDEEATFSGTAAALGNIATVPDPAAANIAAEPEPPADTPKALNRSVKNATFCPGGNDGDFQPDDGSADTGNGSSGDAAPSAPCTTAAAEGTATQLPAGALPAVKPERPPNTPTRGGSAQGLGGAENAAIRAIDLDGSDDVVVGTAECPIVISSDDSADDAVDGQSNGNVPPPLAPAEATASPALSLVALTPASPEPPLSEAVSSQTASSEPASPSSEAADTMESAHPMQLQLPASPDVLFTSPAAPATSESIAAPKWPPSVPPSPVLLWQASAPKAVAQSARPSPQPVVVPRPVLAPSPLVAFSRRSSPIALMTAATPSRQARKTPSQSLQQPLMLSLVSSPASSPSAASTLRVTNAAPTSLAPLRAAAPPLKAKPATELADTQKAFEHKNGIWHRPDTQLAQTAMANAAPMIPERPNGIALTAPRKFVRKLRTDGDAAAPAPVPRARVAQFSIPQCASQPASVLPVTPPRPSAAGARATATPPMGTC